MWKSSEHFGSKQVTSGAEGSTVKFGDLCTVNVRERTKSKILGMVRVFVCIIKA